MKQAYAEQIKGMPPTVQESLIQEAPRALIREPIPSELSFLFGFTDLGFKYLGLTDKELHEILLAYTGVGVIVPKTNLRLRFEYPFARFQPLDGTETKTLPDNWLEGVIAHGKQNEKHVWVGKKAVWPDFNHTDYIDTKEGWLLSRRIT